MLPWLGVLRHEEHFAALLSANLLHKLGKAGGVGEIDIGVRFHAVPVAAGDEKHVAFLRQLPHRAIFVPVAQPVQFQRMDEMAVLDQELIYQTRVPFRPDHEQIP